MQETLREIPGVQEWIVIQAIDKGWSADRKYYVQDTLGKEWHLRLSDISQYERKRWEFETVKSWILSKCVCPVRLILVYAMMATKCFPVHMGSGRRCQGRHSIAGF